jgi:hypothetical protein
VIASELTDPIERRCRVERPYRGAQVPAHDRSYAGQFNIMAVGDADAYTDIDIFAASARDDLRVLVESNTQVRGPRTPT